MGNYELIDPTKEMMSYGRLLKDRNEFRKSGTPHGSDFNIFDTPSLKFFKILFYFHGRNEFEDETNATGLLVPAWSIFEKPEGEEGSDESNKNNTPAQYWRSTSAWAYLKMNDENERAEKLEKFISLLSNINSESPWYFSSISGLDSAIERKSVTDGKLDVNETKRIQLKCLPDAVDDRIGTLLSLYRDITWSWSMKREILPSNLRKFDMAVYVYEAPIKYFHDDTDVIDGLSGFKPSYKMFEFHNCEFDYNSIKTGYTEISNGTGIQPTYTIDIMFDDCYEVAYNSILMRTIGDIIETDTKYVGMIGKDKADPNPSIASIAQQDDSDQLSELQMRMKRSHGFLGNLIGQSVGLVAGGVSTIAKRLLLGNIYTVSLTQAAMDLKSLASGNVISTVQKSLDYASTFQDKPSYMAPGIPSYLTSTSYINTVKKKAPSEGNIYKSVEELAAGTQQDTPETQSVQVTQTTKPVKKLGNIFNKASIANN